MGSRIATTNRGFALIAYRLGGSQFRLCHRGPLGAALWLAPCPPYSWRFVGGTCRCRAPPSPTTSARFCPHPAPSFTLCLFGDWLHQRPCRQRRTCTHLCSLVG